MKAPVGKLRFREPEALDGNCAEVDATRDCPSYLVIGMMTNKLEGQESAGYINVFTKNIHPEKLYPVMVWVDK